MGEMSRGFRFRCRMARSAITAVLSLGAGLAYVCGRYRRAIDLVMTLDRGAFPGPLPRLLRRSLAPSRSTDSRWLGEVRTKVMARCRAHMNDVQPQPQTARFYAKPEALLGPVVMVVKSATDEEKGVLVLAYSYVFPLLGQLFDLERIVRRYHLVLEPSWSGYCNPDVLCYRGVDERVFVQAYEPRDREFIEVLQSNLVAVPISANWWIDHRVFAPMPAVSKDLDVIMIAGWASYKRHAQFFAALRTLRRRGIRLKVALVGYSLGLTVADLQATAAAHHVDDQIEWYEGVSQSDVNLLLNRSKVSVIWSRKEGVNRAIIEGMFAGVPCILRDGFNYGYRYPYINDATGRFAAEDELPDALVWMVDNYQQFDPRSWVMEQMSCQLATAILERTIRDHAPGPWTTPMAVKISGLHGMQYWDADDAARFASDYEFLASTVNPRRF